MRVRANAEAGSRSCVLSILRAKSACRGVRAATAPRFAASFSAEVQKKCARDRRHIDISLLSP
eukprot:1215877-Alexandrium_andersonii.AAC.1